MFSPEEYTLSLFQELWLGLNIGIRARLLATNKERIEALEAGLGGVQDGMQQLEDTVNRLSEIFLSTRENSNNHNNGREGIV